MSEQYLLDASALLALLNEEPGSEQIADILEHALISTVNLCEVGSKLAEHGIPAELIQNTLGQLNLNCQDFIPEMAYIAASLRVKTKKHGLSLGDRACLATAIALELPVITADKIWKKLNLGLDITCIR